MVNDWAHTAGIIPCQAQPGPAHGPWCPPVVSGYREAIAVI